MENPGGQAGTTDHHRYALSSSRGCRCIRPIRSDAKRQLANAYSCTATTGELLMMKNDCKWQDLPGGGAVHSEAGIPVEVTDKGAWQLCEDRILSDAQEATMTKLTWMHLNRSRRWQKTPFSAVLRPHNEWSWCIAKVAQAACDSCGIQLGKHWITVPGTSNRIWMCETCAAHSSTNTDVIMEIEPHPR